VEAVALGVLVKVIHNTYMLITVIWHKAQGGAKANRSPEKERRQEEEGCKNKAARRQQEEGCKRKAARRKQQEEGNKRKAAGSRQQEEGPSSRPLVLLPIFVSNADEQNNHSVKQSFIYNYLIAVLQPAFSFECLCHANVLPIFEVKGTEKKIGDRHKHQRTNLDSLARI
jgi:hypothetical protein